MYKGKRIQKSFWSLAYKIAICFWFAIILVIAITYDIDGEAQQDAFESCQTYVMYEETGRIPGDDIPATHKFEPSAEDLASIPWEVGPTNWIEHKANLVCSAYTASIEECGKDDGITFSGAKVKANHTIAVDHYNPYFKIGTQIQINGITYTVEDTGDLNKYGRDLDIYFDSYDAAKAFGVQTLEVTWYEVD